MAPATDTVAVRVGRWVWDILPTFINALSAVWLGVAGIRYSLPTVPPWLEWVPSLGWMLFQCCVGTLVGTIWLHHRQGSISALREDNALLQARVARLEDELNQAAKDYRDIVEDYLTILAVEKLQLGPRDRVSLYKHEPESKTFVLLGRFSSNTRIRQTGRGAYPDDQGYIAETWREGTFFITNLPDPEQSLSKYTNKVSTTCKIDRKVVRQLPMKSRVYIGIRIDVRLHDADAVLMFESVSTDLAGKKEQIEALMNGPERQQLVRLLEKYRRYEPTPMYARQEGF